MTEEETIAGMRLTQMGYEPPPGYVQAEVSLLELQRICVIEDVMVQEVGLEGGFGGDEAVFGIVVEVEILRQLFSHDRIGEMII